MRFYMKVKSLRYKYTERITEILHSFGQFFVGFKKKKKKRGEVETSFVAREMAYYILAVEHNGWEKRKKPQRL